MHDSINYSQINVSAALSILIVVMTMVSVRWRARNREYNVVNAHLTLMLNLILILCIVNPITFLTDGVPGTFWRAVQYICNWILFAANIIIGILWLGFICIYTRTEVGKVGVVALVASVLFPSIVLVANPWTSWLFYLDDANVYHRGDLYWSFMFVEFAFAIAGTIVYLVAKYKGGALKFFPVVQFALPALSGEVIQNTLYGVATMVPFLAVSAYGLTMGIQNESLFMDNLTEAYNRFYLDHLKIVVNRKNRTNMTALMMDMNGFKQINDEYGHNEGDKALIAMAQILMRVVGNRGVVIRYAGDEFVLLINSQNTELVNRIISDIHTNLDKHNAKHSGGYKLSVSIGSMPINLKEQSVDDILNKVDQRMYEEKKRFYLKHRGKQPRCKWLLFCMRKLCDYSAKVSVYGLCR